MNSVTISGTVAGDSELRRLDSGRELLNFDIHVDGNKPGESPCIRCALFPMNGDPRELKAGRRVLVSGALRHRRDYGRIFVAVSELVIFEDTRAVKDAKETPGGSVAVTA